MVFAKLKMRVKLQFRAKIRKINHFTKLFSIDRYSLQMHSQIQLHRPFLL